MSGYERDLTLERHFAKTIKSILGCQFIGQDVQHDRSQATDFEIFTIKPLTVAARLRRYKYWLKYSEQFTIRWARPAGVATEIDKIRSGFADYLLYGFVNQDETTIIQYFIGDLAVFRQTDPQPLEICNNNPPDSQLAVYALKQFPPSFIIKRWRKCQELFTEPLQRTSWYLL